MDQYVPPLVAVATGIVIVLLCFILRVPFFIIGLLSIVMIGYTLQDHMIRFMYEYQHAMSPAFLRKNASIFIIGLVILMSLGFLLLKFGPSTITNNARTPFDGRRPQQSSWNPFSALGKIFGTTGTASRTGYDGYGSRSSRYGLYNNDDDYRTPYASSRNFANI